MNIDIDSFLYFFSTMLIELTVVLKFIFSGKQMEASEGNPERGLTNDQPVQGDPQRSIALFQEKVRLAGNACTQADFTLAVKLYGEALQLDPRLIFK